MPKIELMFTNEIGYKKILKNIPKITDLINSSLKNILIEKVIFPNEITFKLK
jgi:D-ribose pyranose/furanose isomerase RbsD